MKQKKQKNSFIDKSLGRKIFPIIWIIIVIVLIIMIIFTPWRERDLLSYHAKRTINDLFSSIGAIIIVFIALLLSTFFSFLRSCTLRYSSIKDEVLETNFDKPNDKHFVLSILHTTPKDCFVLAFFKQRNDIRPAVYTRFRKKVSQIDLYTYTTHFEKINLINSYYGYETNDIAIQRIKHKFTKTQMIFFASERNNLEIKIDNQPVPILNKIGKFSVYGMVENPKCVCDTVNIDGYNYPLIETPKPYRFIDKKQI